MLFYPQANRWISAMFVLYWPYAEAWPGEDVFEDRKLDITSQMNILVREMLNIIKNLIKSRST